MQRERVPCLVPFCLRTTDRERLTARGHSEWICGRHWGGVPERARAVYRRALAAERRSIAADAASSARLVAEPVWWLLPETAPIVVERMTKVGEASLQTVRCRRLWSALRRRAIEAGGGIT